MSAIDDLIAAAHALAAAGLSPGTSGNLSVRHGQVVQITCSGAAMRRLRPDDVCAVTLDGRVLAGRNPTKELGMHLAAYRARPDAGAIVHLHAPAATAVSCLAVDAGADPLPAYTPYRIRQLGRVAVVPYAPPGSTELAESVGRHAVASRALLLAHHGSIVCATDIETAVDVSEELEAAAQLTLALAGRGARTLDADRAWG
jgi:L-fuculose-phosphate aldolase